MLWAGETHRSAPHGRLRNWTAPCQSSFYKICIRVVVLPACVCHVNRFMLIIPHVIMSCISLYTRFILVQERRVQGKLQHLSVSSLFRVAVVYAWLQPTGTFCVSVRRQSRTATTDTSFGTIRYRKIKSWLLLLDLLSMLKSSRKQYVFVL